MKRALAMSEQLEEQNLNMPAKTLDGLKAKIRCAEAWAGGEVASISIDGLAADIMFSIIEDIESMSVAHIS
ncbi:hypothetical protein [Bradyrhizobium pachyrhizi]|uniref:hypothetical protein n=1 Tax=Bradyrhizobium pachyrhizi TaxID=280333 RepID=UPI00067BE381|nr:hypothetical protein [Bradyrhizobium pachyrhizi]